ncbi:MAG: zinc-ribbon domain-containing protein, partial [Thermodesulfobacteriota bacterium]
MIIQCEKCKRKFEIEDSRLASQSSMVRCRKCGHVSVIDKMDLSADEVENNAIIDVVPIPDDRGYIDEQDSGVGVKDESKSQLPSLGPDSDVASTERTERTGQQKSETPQGFEFKYPLSGNVTGTAAGEHTLHGQAREERNGGDYEKVTVDEGNWEQFVSISKAERDIDEFKIKNTRKTRTGESGFDWENLRINDELVDAQRGLPKMFEDEGMDSEEAGLIGNEVFHEPAGDDNTPRESGNRERAYEGSASDERLMVDMDVLITNPHSVTRTVGSPRAPYHDSYRARSVRDKSNSSGILSRVAYGVLTIVVFTVIVSASYIILSNTGIIPGDTAQNIEKAVESVIPFDIAVPLKKDVVITENRGKWLDTRNGPMYVI